MTANTAEVLGRKGLNRLSLRRMIWNLPNARRVKLNEKIQIPMKKEIEAPKRKPKTKKRGKSKQEDLTEDEDSD